MSTLLSPDDIMSVSCDVMVRVEPLEQQTSTLLSSDDIMSVSCDVMVRAESRQFVKME